MKNQYNIYHSPFFLFSSTEIIKKHAGTTAGCPVDENMDESWFTEQMDDEMNQSTGVKPKKLW